MGSPSARKTEELDNLGKGLFVLVHGENALRVWHLDRLRARLTELGLGW